VFTTLAWDNIDRLEDTLSGEGTSHRVNEISVQSMVAGSVPEKVLPEVTKSKKRSITPTALGQLWAKVGPQYTVQPPSPIDAQG
jgi:hypothetical protein